MRYLTMLIAALVLLSACGGGTAATTTTTTLPTATTAQGCENVAYIIPSSEDAIIEISRVYTYLQKEKPEVVGTEFDGELLQLTREGGYNLITVRFSNDLGTMLFVQEPGYVFHIGWEGPATSESEIRDSLNRQFPDFPEDVISCHDMSLLVASG
jgi:hypothetical protein